MALNKFMHSRNIYKTPPNFLELAKEYPEFSEVAKKDISGKVSIDFRDPHALRVLTKCLLQSDFNLDVNIPEDRLVPTLPLRLNYILWVEDLLCVAQIKEPIWGIDIGTGACAIYPLLAAVKNKWHMIGTETDMESLRIAKQNVEKNNLKNLIELKENPAKSIFEYIFLDDTRKAYSFCMCNPPFYTNLQELYESRSLSRPEPKNGFTGSPHELITEGGELQFCRKIIQESKVYKDNILIFTTMVGHKYNLKELEIDLKADGIRYTTTEFCQGRVTRWGLAWTYRDYDFSKLVGPKHKLRKKSTPIVFILPKLPAPENDLTVCLEKIRRILRELKIAFKIINKRKNEVALNIIAHCNTWSNQRRKRRLLKRIEESHAKQPKIESPQISELGKMDPQNNNFCNTNNDSETKNKELTKDEEEIIVQGILKLFIRDNHPNIEVEYINGIAGKEGLHQIVQYIKNNWK